VSTVVNVAKDSSSGKLFGQDLAIRADENVENTDEDAIYAIITVILLALCILSLLSCGFLMHKRKL